MLRRSPIRRLFDPELYRYGHSTFHDGHHRQAPGDSTPWRERNSMYVRLRSWWMAPAAKGSTLAAWTVTAVACIYVVSLSQDAKGTYVMNTSILRNLHQETLRADLNQQRVAELEQMVHTRLSKEQGMKADHRKSLEQCNDSKEVLKTGLVNYEAEMNRERTRVKLTHDRNKELVRELQEVRSALTVAEKDNERLTREVMQLQRHVKKMEM